MMISGFSCEEKLMRRLNVIRLAMLALSFLCGCAQAQAAAAPAPARPPNILFVFIDDMGYRDLSCFGGTRVKTAEIDRLAGEGLRFNQFYVSSPICSPSRVAVTTGQYPSRWRITSFLSTRADDQQRQMADWLPVEAPSLGRSLAAAGYYTAHVGKWHMGGQRDVGDAPLITQYGFATSITNFEGLGPRILPKFAKEKHVPTELSAKFGGPGAQWENRDKVSQRFVDRAIREMDAAAKKGTPFYINLWPDDVHSPFQPPAALRGDGSKEALYCGALKELDRQLGRVFEHVRSNAALRDNTLILVASDNGHEPGAGTAGSLRGAKGQLYEGGIRSPLIVWGPGQLAASMKPGSTNDATVIAGIDLPPTLLAVAGVASPDGVTLDGRDMSAALLGKSAETRGAPLMWVRPPDRPGPSGKPMPDLAIRDGDWKLLVRRDGAGVELFDVVQDPDEKNNQATAQPDLAKRLSDAVIAWDDATAGNTQTTAITD
jgi:arylsulfatase A-like enzyme